MRNISIHLTSAVGDFCLMRVLRGYVILQNILGITRLRISAYETLSAWGPLYECHHLLRAFLVIIT